MTRRAIKCLATLLIAGAAGFAAGCTARPVVNASQAYVDAMDVLRQATEDLRPQVRTRGLEALAATEGAAAGHYFAQALRDEYAPVQFAAAMAIGDTRYVPARPTLLELAQDEQTPPKLKIAVIYALHQLGDDAHTSQLGQFVHSRDDSVRATAAMIMGRMGERSALGPLRSLWRDEQRDIVRLNVVEAMACLGDEAAIASLEGWTRVQHMEDRIIAVQAFGRIRTVRSMEIVKGALESEGQEPLVRATAAGSLAQLGENSGYKYALRCVTDPVAVLQRVRPKDATINPIEVSNLQSLASLSLGYMKQMDAVPVLKPLLASPDALVRVAAAKAILQLTATYRPKDVAPAKYRVQPSGEPETPATPQTQPAPAAPITIPATPLTPAKRVEPPAAEPVTMPSPPVPAIPAPTTGPPATKPAAPPIAPTPAPTTAPVVAPLATEPAPALTPDAPSPATKPSLPLHTSGGRD